LSISLSRVVVVVQREQAAAVALVVSALALGFL
jgi:hypothetical protein